MTDLQWLIFALPGQIPAEFESSLPELENVPILLVPEKGTPGVWTDRSSRLERIRFGFPEDGSSSWFRLLKPMKNSQHNALSQAIERMLFARKIDAIASLSPQFAPVIKKAVHPHKSLIKLWFYTREDDPESWKELLNRITNSQGLE